jgi:hypothetical protein
MDAMHFRWCLENLLLGRDRQQKSLGDFATVGGITLLLEPAFLLFFFDIKRRLLCFLCVCGVRLLSLILLACMMYCTVVLKKVDNGFKLLRLPVVIE